MEGGRISSLQLGMLMYPTIVATAALTVPAITANYAKQDLWISPIWASLIGFLTVYIVFSIYKHFPNQSFFQICDKTLGVFLGKSVGFSYVFIFFIYSGHITRDYADFVRSVFFQETPILIVIITILVLSAFTIMGGIEVIGRISQLFFPIYFLSLFLIIVLLIPQLQVENILPFMGNGLTPSLKGAMIPQAWFGEFFFIIFLLPFLSDIKKGMKSIMLMVFLVLITFVMINLTVLFILGPSTERAVYPFLYATRFVDIANFIENIDALILALWVLGTYVKITVFYYITTLGLAQWLNLSDYKPLVWPIGILIIEFSFWTLPNVIASAYFNVHTFPFLAILMQTLFPLLLLGIVTIKKKFINTT